VSWESARSIIDPHGDGPRIWFHAVPDAKVVKNRLHLDIHASTDGLDHYAVGMKDPEGNEFDIN
jgi:hypothetical protein